jgi:nucleotide-binding universal stress UspA family protein
MSERTNIMGKVVVPIVDEEDAEKTVQELQNFDVEDISVVFVVERSEGGLASTPRTLYENVAQNVKEIFRSVYPDCEFQVIQSEDSVDSIVEVALESGATSIVFRPEQHSFMSRLLSNNTLELIEQATIPVIALPEPEVVEE